MNTVHFTKVRRVIVNGIMLALLAYVMFHIGGCAGSLSKIGMGYRAVTYTVQATNLVSKGIDSYCRPKYDACVKNSKTADEYSKCMDDCGCDKALQLWGLTFPIIKAALAVTLTGLETARQAKTDTDWRKTLKPAVCGLLNAATELKPILGSNADKVFEYLELAGKWVCK